MIRALIKCRKKIFPLQKRMLRMHSQLVGRDLVDAQDIHEHDLKKLIWTALDVKESLSNQLANTTKYNQFHRKHVTLLLSSPDALIQAVTARAVASLSGSLSTTVDSSWEIGNRTSVEDLGRALSTASDLIMVLAHNQASIQYLADGANIPVVAWRSDKFALLHALADIMTIYEHFKLLSPLTVSWVGPPSALFNTYAYMMPRMKINLRFCCNNVKETQMPPELMTTIVKNSVMHKTEARECLNTAEAVYRSDIIVTTAHSIHSLKLKAKEVDEAHLEYIFLHDLPRGKEEVSDNIFKSQHSLVWQSRENLTWIIVAVLLQLSSDLHISSPHPRWEME